MHPSLVFGRRTVRAEVMSPAAGVRAPPWEGRGEDIEIAGTTAGAQDGRPSTCREDSYMAKIERHYVGSGLLVGHLQFEPATDVRVYREHLENSLPPAFEKICRIGSKNAWVVRDYVNGNICLQSYRTIVAMKAGDTSVNFGRWSMTTSRHQGDFGLWCSSHAETV